MPLFSVSPNLLGSDTPSRKLIHEELSQHSIQFPLDTASTLEKLETHKSIEETQLSTHNIELPVAPEIDMGSIPGSSPADLTDAASSPPLRDPPSPNKTPSKSQPTGDKTTSIPIHVHTTASPASMTKTTQSSKRKLTAAKEQEREEKRQKKEADAAERAKKKAADDEAKAVRATEKAKKDAERAKKKAEDEEKKRKKEEEELAAKRKADKQKSMLASFIKRGPVAPTKKPAEQVTNSQKPDNDSPTPQKSSRTEKTMYERTFQPFFVKSGVTLARSPFEMDEETKGVKSAILDEYIRGDRGEFNPKPFNPIKTFEIPFPQKRGITRRSVRKVMERVYGDEKRSESQTEKLVVNAQDELNSIPIKCLSFYEDVRPPYFGTVTTPMESSKLRKLSRRPVGRVLTMDYDYDSEAEWVEDDGEDLGDEEEEDEDHDGDEEMDDFLDDSEDVQAVSRPTFLGETEPTSTGLCFEDRTRVGPSAAVFKYRMEFMLDTLEHHSGIDPFSTAYWPSPQKKVPVPKVTAFPAPTPLPLSTIAPPNTATGASSRLVSAPSSSATAATVDTKDLVPMDVLDDFKRAVTSEELREYSKSTIVDLLAKKFPPCTKVQVKNTLDRVAQRVSVPGAKKSVKQWALLPATATATASAS